MDLGIPPLKIKNLLESNPLKSRFVVRELTVEPFSVVRSCMLMGSTQSGSYVKGVKSTYIKDNPRKFNPKDLSMKDVSLKNGRTIECLGSFEALRSHLNPVRITRVPIPRISWGWAAEVSGLRCALVAQTLSRAKNFRRWARKDRILVMPNGRASSSQGRHRGIQGLDPSRFLSRSVRFPQKKW